MNLLTPKEGYNDILNVLMEWGRSGLIPNTKVIKSYHPPVQDSLTGIPVLMPASTYETGIIPDYSKEIYRDINSYTNVPGGTASRIQDYNPPIGKLVDPQLNVPPKTEVAVETVKYGPLFKEAALTSQTEEEYQENIKNIRVASIADRMTRDVTHNPQYVMNNLQDAKAFVSIKTDVPDDTKIAPKIPNRYEMVPTGIPCAIPGVLNCYVETYDKIDTRRIEYRYSLPMTKMNWRPDADGIRAAGFNPEGVYVLPTGDFDFSTPLDNIGPEDYNS